VPARTVIGITGKKRHGKDTLARLIAGEDAEWRIEHFAAPLKVMVSEVFRLGPNQFRGGLKEAPLAAPIVMDDYLPQMAAVTGLPIQRAGCVASSSRELLQYFGADYVRAARASFWVDLLEQRAAGCLKVVIPDVRFVNEADYVRAQGGSIIRVHRVDLPDVPDAHCSEQGVDLITPDLDLATTTGQFAVQQAVARLIRLGEFDRAMMYDRRR
jgi:hypothetical protein